MEVKVRSISNFPQKLPKDAACYCLPTFLIIGFSISQQTPVDVSSLHSVQKILTVQNNDRLHHPRLLSTIFYDSTFSEYRCIVEIPDYLGVNFEKQIVPRFKVIDHLRTIGGLGEEVGLRELIKPSRMKFYNLYVKPYPECDQIYGRFARNDAVRSQHPVGMWKLFNPQKNPESKQDIMNIKLYMDSLG